MFEKHLNLSFHSNIKERNSMGLFGSSKSSPEDIAKGILYAAVAVMTADGKIQDREMQMLSGFHKSDYLKEVDKEHLTKIVKEASDLIQFPDKLFAQVKQILSKADRNVKKHTYHSMFVLALCDGDLVTTEIEVLKRLAREMDMMVEDVVESTLLFLKSGIDGLKKTQD